MLLGQLKIGQIFLLKVIFAIKTKEHIFYYIICHLRKEQAETLQEDQLIKL